MWARFKAWLKKQACKRLGCYDPEEIDLGSR